MKNTSSTTTRLAASSAASGPDAVQIASAAAADAVEGEIGLLLALVSGDLDHESAARDLAEAAGGAPSAGMSGNGVLAEGGAVEEGCVAMAFGGGIKSSIGVANKAGADQRAAGSEATQRALDGLGEPVDIVLLLIDSTSGDLADTAAGAYAAAGPRIPLAGGSAGGAWKREIHDGEASADSVVAIAISSPGPVAVAETQSARVRGAPAIVTRSEGHLINEIDGRRALDVYLEQIGYSGIPMDSEEFEGAAITHPIAQPEPHGARRLRHVLGSNDDGSLILATTIPPGAAIEFTELVFEDLIRSGAASVTGAKDALSTPPRAALVFDCAGRRRALGDGIAEEVDAISGALGRDIPLAGLYTNGEVARLKGAKGDRNHAVVTVAFG